MVKSMKKTRVKILTLLLFSFITFLSISNIQINHISIIYSDDRQLQDDYIDLEINSCRIDVSEMKAPTGEVFHRLSVEGGFSFRQVGCPIVPLKTLRVLLPYGKDLADIDVQLGEENVLEGNFKLEPAQEPVPFDSEESFKFALKQSVYESEDNYPEKVYSIEGVHELSGYRILVINVFPVRYIPKEGKVSYFENIKVRISLTTSPAENLLYRNLREDENRVSNIVDNPQAILTYREARNSKNYLLKTSALPSGSYDYVIITNEELKNSNGSYTFQDLVDVKNSKGIITTIATTEDIYLNYTGVDNAEKIRNFIIDAYQNWGIKYVLLGGDGDGANVGGESEDPIIPARCLYAEGEQIASDLYYAALNGTWNDDGDGYWGEVGEDDLYAEVYIGRAPVDSEDELSNFIYKTLAHEASNDSYLSTALMVGEYLGSQFSNWGGDYKDEVKNGSDLYGYSTLGFPGYYNVSTLYDRDLYPSEWTKDDLIPILNNGIHVINHLGHSGVDYNMKMYNSDADALTNDKYFFLYSQGCYNGAFDNRDPYDVYHNYDSIAEHFVTNPSGAYACIGNSRYGWGSLPDTNGPSQYFDREFFDAIFGENLSIIGMANQDSKEDNIGVISQSHIRWCYYELNLFGDPTTSIAALPNENAPILSKESASPKIGYQDTQINFEVTYLDTDNNPPSDINVVINGTSYMMNKQDLADSNYIDGCVYEYITYLKSGNNNYTYYFECNDGEYYFSTRIYSDINISYFNINAPTLSEGQVTPDDGYTGWSYEFNVNYTDEDNNEPDYVNVSVDSMLYQMEKQDPLDLNYMDGSLYVVDVILNEIGNYSYEFFCSDGNFTSSVGPFSGPVLEELNTPFDGMYINHTFILGSMGSITSYKSQIAYSQISENIYNVSWYLGGGIPLSFWNENTQTRLTSDSHGGFGDDVHSPIWIYPNTALGNEVQIAVAYEGDHLFLVSDDLIANFSGLGMVDAWVLEDLTLPGGWAWYEKNTGILLNGSFLYSGGMYNYSFEITTTNVNISDLEFPSAEFISNSTTLYVNDTVQFTFTGFEGDTPATYYWEFGDGFNSTAQNPTHFYTNPGNYTVSLNITDNDGDDDLEIKYDYITVLDRPDFTPIANFSADSTTIFVNSSVQFTFTGYGGDAPTTYLWDFGDGNFSTTQNPIHQYANNGTYTVILNVTDNDGDMDWEIKYNYITVVEYEIPSYVSINEGDIYEYGMFTNPTIPPDNPYYFGGNQFVRMKCEIDSIVIEDPFYEKVLVIYNYSYMYGNGTWIESPMPSSYNYIYKEYTNYNETSFPFFVSNIINWNDFVVRITTMYPPEVNVSTLENGWATDQISTMYENDLIRYEYIYTPDGVMNITNMYVNGTLYATYRLNDFDFEFEIPDDYPLGIEVDEQYSWIVGNVNATLMEMYFGPNWEQVFGLPQNSSELSKMKINITSINRNGTHEIVDYSLWNWIDKDDPFGSTAAFQDILMYYENPLNYPMGHNLTNLLPLFLPTPSYLYLSQASLDLSFYSIYIDTTFFYNYTVVSFSINLDTRSLQGQAFYDTKGILHMLQIKIVTPPDPQTMIPDVENIFTMYRDFETPIPSYVGINEGDIYEYGVYNCSLNLPPSYYFSQGRPERVKVKVKHIGGENPMLENALILMDLFVMDAEGVWTRSSGYELGMYGDCGYIGKNFSLNSMTNPFFMRTNANWSEVASGLQDYYDSAGTPPDFIFNTFALSDGYLVKQNMSGVCTETSVRYTNNGVLNIMSQTYEGKEFYTWRLNDFDYVILELDNQAPNITILEPLSNAIYGLDAPNFNISIQEPYLNTTWYSLFNGTWSRNVTFTSETKIDQDLWNLFSNAPITIRFYANDTNHNLGWMDVSIDKDVAPPIIDIIFPEEGLLYGYSLSFIVNIDEVYLNETWYTLNGGEKIFFDGFDGINTGTIDPTAWLGCADGPVVVFFYANDTSGKLSFDNITIYKDAQAPSINIITPEDGLLCGSSVSFSVDISDINLDEFWYTLNGGDSIFLNVTSGIYTGMINSTSWLDCVDGSVVIIFYASDTAGNVAFDMVTVEKDTNDPVITIDIPELGDEYENAPIYNISIEEPNLEYTWYTMNGGEKMFFSGIEGENIGVIDSIIWEALADGPITIIFYANDTLGNEDSATVIIYKIPSAPPTPGIPGANPLIISAILFISIVLLVRKSKRKLK